MYRIREVDTDDDDICDTIKDLHVLSFGDSAPVVDPSEGGFWWLAYNDNEPIGFACITQSTLGSKYAYLKRVGVLPKHRGKGLQYRFIKVRERKAKKIGWGAIITDTTSNPASANALIRAGFKTFSPECPWSFRDAIYWRKFLR